LGDLDPVRELPYRPAAVFLPQAGKWRVMLTVTLPLVLPGVAGAAVFVFAEMLGSFAAAFVLGIPARFGS
jgi:ABC-type Fe3+ transport system permease subunit